jgi:hypothetical protein
MICKAWKYWRRLYCEFVKISLMNIRTQLFKYGRGSHLILIAALAFFLLPVSIVQADVGPKPGLHMTFEYEIDPVSIVSGQLIECDDEACTSGEPLQELGPQRFECSENECSSISYGYTDYQKIVIQFEDGTRESNVFTKKAMNAEYIVTVKEDSLSVREKFKIGSIFYQCCNSLALTLIIETLIASLFLGAFHIPRSFLGLIPLASLVTLPAVWFVFPYLPLAPMLNTGLSEIFAVLAETAVIYWGTVKTIPLRQVLLLSFLMNAASFGIGLLA